jgi:hypothetical protein
MESITVSWMFLIWTKSSLRILPLVIAPSSSGGLIVSQVGLSVLVVGHGAFEGVEVG